MPDNLNGYMLKNQMQGRLRSVYLNGSEDAPPYAALEIYGHTYNGGLLVRKPSRDDIPAQFLIFNTDGYIGKNSWGLASNTWPVVSRYNNALDLGNRENIGTVSGQWYLSKGYEGMVGIGQIEDGSELAAVMPFVRCRSGQPGAYYSGGGGCVCCHCCGCHRFGPQDTRHGCNSSVPDQLTMTITADCIGTRTLTLDKVTTGIDWPNGGYSCNSPLNRPKFPYAGTFTSGGGSGIHPATPYCDDIVGVLFPDAFESLTVGLYCGDCESAMLENTCAEASEGGILGNSDLFGGGDCESPPLGHGPNTTWRLEIAWSWVSWPNYGQINYSGPITLNLCTPLSWSLTDSAVCATTDGIANCTGSCTVNCCTTPYTVCVGSGLQVDIDE